MVAGKMTVTGGPETAKAFDALAKDMADLKVINKRIAEGRLPGVRGLTPVRTGALVASWKAGGTKKAGRIRSNLQHAAPIESGVPERNIIGVGMVRRTIEADQGAIVTEYEAAIRDAARARGFRV